jgi:outer membrane biogenesis lipoprotein LolB
MKAQNVVILILAQLVRFCSLDVIIPTSSSNHHPLLQQQQHTNKQMKNWQQKQFQLPSPPHPFSMGLKGMIMLL